MDTPALLNVKALEDEAKRLQAEHDRLRSRVSELEAEVARLEGLGLGLSGERLEKPKAAASRRQ